MWKKKTNNNNSQEQVFDAHDINVYQGARVEHENLSLEQLKNVTPFRYASKFTIGFHIYTPLFGMWLNYKDWIPQSMKYNQQNPPHQLKLNS